MSINFKLLVLMGMMGATAFAHHGVHHAPGEMHVAASPGVAEVLKKLNAEYVQQVKPIFARSCMDCHSSVTRYPWYHSIPGIRQFIDHDIAESREHIDLSHDFPFGGHGSPLEDLEAIGSEIREGDMPPIRYWLLHPSARLSPADQTVIEAWIERGKAELAKK